MKPLDFDKFRKKFRWQTMQGKIVTINQMDTKHIFNSMKMIFNHVAEANGLPTVWFNNRYTEYEVWSEKIPEEMLMQMCFFMIEIENRGDLPEKYYFPYNQIKTILQRASKLQLQNS